MADFLMGVYAELLAGAVIFLIGYLWTKIPKSLEIRKLRKFFGDAILTENVVIVYGALERSKTLGNDSGMYKKEYRSGKTREVPLFGRVVSPALVKSYSHVIQNIGRLRKTPFNVQSDDQALDDLERSFISLGGPIVNGLTDWVLEEEAQGFVGISIPDVLYEPPPTIDVYSDGAVKKSFESVDGKDYGLILKVRNSSSNSSGQFYFVCAGIRTTGAISAAWYLATRWKQLLKQFNTKEFFVVLEVKRGVVMSAKPVHEGIR